MANTRFSLTNLVDGATVLNSGAGAHGGVNRPSLDQDADFPMSNVTVADRYTKWKSSGTLDPTDIDLDLGGVKSVQLVSLLNYKSTSGVAALTCSIYTSATYAPAAWTLRGTITLNAATDNNPILDMGTPVSARYWRLEFSTVAAAWTLGRIWLGATPTDLGFLYSPGSSRNPRRVRSTLETDGGIPITFDKGDKRRRFTYQFQSVVDTTRSTLESLMDKTGSFLYIDQGGNPFECRIDSEMNVSHRWYGGSQLWDISLTMEQLP